MKQVEKLGLDYVRTLPVVWDHDPFVHYVAGFRACRNQILAELKNIAAQTEDPAVMALVVRFERFGEE